MAKKYNIDEWKSQIIEVCNTSKSMAEASSKLTMNYKTFAKLAKEIGCSIPNKSGKGIAKNSGTRYLLKDILNGKYPQYQSYKIKIRMLEEGVKEHQCENCNLKEWQKIQIPLELHHKDGNSNNHKLDNLELLCPNCHALTDTYRFKRGKCRD